MNEAACWMFLNAFTVTVVATLTSGQIDAAFTIGLCCVVLSLCMKAWDEME